MRKTRTLLTVAAIIAVLSTIVGCGPSADSSNTAAKETNKGEPVKLTVEVFDRGKTVNGETANDNKWTKWIHDQVLKELNIDVTYVMIPRSQEVPKLNVLMATGDAPDIVFTYDQNTVFNYAKSGGLTDVSGLLDKYAPDLKQYLGKDLLPYGVFSGKQIAIPAKRAFVGESASIIRKDWLDKLNLPVPTTTETFLSTMQAFKDKDPGGTGGKTAPYGISSFEAGTNSNLISSFIQRGSEEEFYAKFDLLMPGYKEGVRFMNQMYNKGLISRDFPLDKDGKKFESDLVNGYMGAATLIGLNAQNLDTLKKNVPGAEFVVMDPFTDSNGKHPKHLYSPMDKYILIPKSSKNAEAAIQYLNWMAKKDNLFMIVNGVKDEDYKLVNDMPVGIENLNHLNNRFDLSIITNGLDFGNNEKNIQFYVSNKTPTYLELGTEHMKKMLVDGYSSPMFDRPIEAAIKYGSVLKDKKNEILTKSVVAKPSDFDSVYDSGMKEYMSLGGQEVLDEQTKAYRDMKAGK